MVQFVYYINMKKVLSLFSLISIFIIAGCTKNSDVELIYYSNFTSHYTEYLQIIVTREELDDNIPYSNIFNDTNMDMKFNLFGNPKKDDSLIITFDLNIGSRKCDEYCYEICDQLVNIFINQNELTKDNIKYSHYLGNYDDVQVVVINDNVNKNENVKEVIDDVIINYHLETDNILAFYENQIYTLEEAYNNNLLKINDLKFIKYMYNYYSLNDLYLQSKK